MRRSPLPALLAVFLAMIPGIATAGIQNAMDPNLVYVQVTVMDNSGVYVTGLPKQSFKIREDEKPQDIAYFSSNEDAISVGIIVDARGDLKQQMKATAAAALTGYRNPLDQFAVIEPDEGALNDVVSQGINKVLQLRNTKRALILFTDRDPGAYSFSKVRELLKDQDVQLYAITVARPGESPNETLRNLAESSGGNAFFPSNIANVEGIYKNIVRGLKNQYVIGYRPTNQARDGKWRKMKISAEFVDRDKKVSKATIRAKSGYYAPTVVESSPAKN